MAIENMKTNFEIEENYAVRLNGTHIELHNNFEFKEISELDNNVRIEFIKSNQCEKSMMDLWNTVNRMRMMI